MGSLAPYTALHPSLEWKFPRPFVLPFRVGLIVSLIGTLGGGAETIFGSSEKSHVHGPLGAFGLLIGLESMTSCLWTAPPVKDAKWPFHYAPVQRSTNLPSTQASLQGSHPDYALLCLNRSSSWLCVLQHLTQIPRSADRNMLSFDAVARTGNDPDLVSKSVEERGVGPWASTWPLRAPAWNDSLVWKPASDW
ncbi:hypothetical protein HD554DRAFT_1798688 [Boletus coccyginus]|nr:hypothetical protein HD554DRAFT_1798688 [Boletus coccyginus]